MVSTNLDGFNLVNHGQFAKLSPHQTFQLYGIKAFSHNYSQILYSGFLSRTLSNTLKI